MTELKAVSKTASILLDRLGIAMKIARLQNNPKMLETIETFLCNGIHTVDEAVMNQHIRSLENFIEHTSTSSPDDSRSDEELPGMWSHADFTGGSTDSDPRGAIYTNADKMRQALEIIAVGDSSNPAATAADVLVETGFWEDIPNKAEKPQG